MCACVFSHIYFSVAQQSAPTVDWGTTLDTCLVWAYTYAPRTRTCTHGAFLEPLRTRLALEVSLDLFAQANTHTHYTHMPPPPQCVPTTTTRMLTCRVRTQAAFLDPLKTRLALEVSLDLFARSDVEFMAMFTGGCVGVTTCDWVRVLVRCARAVFIYYTHIPVIPYLEGVYTGPNS